MPLAPQRGTAAARVSSLHRGTIIDTPASPADHVRVVIPEFGAHYWGPISWPPRVDGLGRLAMPAAGAACVIALDARRQPLCIVAWGDGTETGAGADVNSLADIVAGMVGLGPIVTSLPAGPTAGQAVRFRHTAGQAPWLCIWDPALNSGAGAWTVIGAAPLTAVQSSGASGSSAAINTWAALPNTPTIAIPVAGIWDIAAAGNITNESSGAKQARVRIWTGAAGSRVVGSHVSSGATQSSSPGGATVRMTLTAGTVSLQMCTDNTTVTFGAAAELWSLAAIPIELRP